MCPRHRLVCALALTAAAAAVGPADAAPGGRPTAKAVYQPAPGSYVMPVWGLMRKLHSRQGHAVLQRWLRKAERPGHRSPFLDELHREYRRLRRRSQPSAPWKLWERQRPVDLMPATVLNVLSRAFIFDHSPDAWPAGWKDHPQKGLALFIPARLGGAGAGRRRYAKEARAFYDELNAATFGDGDVTGLDLEHVSYWTVFNGLNKRAAAALSHHRLLPDMPLLDWSIKRWGKLKARAVLAREPLRGNTAAYLLGSGLDPRKLVFWTDKEHFLDPRAATALKEAGAQLRGSIETDGRFIKRWIRRQVASLRREGLSEADIRQLKPQFLVRDDGARLHQQVIAALRDPQLARYAHLFAGYEQTTKGIRPLQRLGRLPYGIVDGARSEAKNLLFSPYLGTTLAGQALREMQHLISGGVALNKTVAVIGRGRVGEQVAFQMEAAGFNVLTVEPREEIRARLEQRHLVPFTTRRVDFDGKPLPSRVAQLPPAEREAFIAAKRAEAAPRDKLDALAAADVVISCTGVDGALSEADIKAVAQRRAGRTQLWINGASPGEIAPVSRAMRRNPTIRVDARGIVSGAVGDRRLTLGQRSAPIDINLLVSHQGAHFVIARQGHVLNGRTDVQGVYRDPRDTNWSFRGIRRAPGPGFQSDDPIPGVKIQGALALSHVAGIQALAGGEATLKPVREGLQRALITVGFGRNGLAKRPLFKDLVLPIW